MVRFRQHGSVRQAARGEEGHREQGRCGLQRRPPDGRSPQAGAREHEGLGASALSIRNLAQRSTRGDRAILLEQRIGVLWATHLLDEIVLGDDLVVRHQGCVLAKGHAARIVNDAGASDLNSAFMKLTGTDPQLGGTAS